MTAVTSETMPSRLTDALVLRGRRGRLLEHAPAAALVISLAFNALVMLVATQFGISAGGGGWGGSRDRDFDLTVTSEASLTAIPEEALPGDVPAVSTPSELPDLPTSGISEGSGGVDSPASGEGLGEIADGLGGAGGGDIGEGAGIGGGAGGGSAKFFGIEARGSRFAYIVDVSGSMNQPPNKLVQLKVELNESIGALLEHMAVVVVAFNDTPHVLGGKMQWLRTAQAEKDSMRGTINSMIAEGGTDPKDALDRCLTMRPPPDAIYFMTDGQFDADIARVVAEKNRGARRIPIHCIAFGQDAAEELMRKIATDSGGTYRQVKGPK